MNGLLLYPHMSRYDLELAHSSTVAALVMLATEKHGKENKEALIRQVGEWLQAALELSVAVSVKKANESLEQLEGTKQ